MSLNAIPTRVLMLHNHDNTWTAADLIEVAEENQKLMDGLRANGYHVEDVKVFESVATAVRARGYDPDEWLVFNWCEGYVDRPWEYDGVAEELEQLQFEYTGSGPWTLRVSRDKWLVRRMLAEAGVPLAFGALARTATDIKWNVFPAIVKPVNQHASYGISREAIVEDERQLRQRVEYVRDTFQSAALIEEFIDGPEYHVAVWGNTPPTVLPAVQLAYNHLADWRDRIYTYEAKFDEHSAAMAQIRFLCPAMLEPRTRRSIKFAALQASRTLRCRDYARLDLRVRNGQAYVVDVNANPDISSFSVTAMAAQAAGMDYTEMVTQIVRFAGERWARTRRPIRLPTPQHRWAANLHRAKLEPQAEASGRGSDRKPAGDS